MKDKGSLPYLIILCVFLRKLYTVKQSTTNLNSFQTHLPGEGRKVHEKVRIVVIKVVESVPEESTIIHREWKGAR